MIKGRAKKVKRLEYTFQSILNGGKPESILKQEFQEMDLFSDYYENKQSDLGKKSKNKYAIVKWTDIYKEELV